MEWQALALSFRLAAVVSALLLLIGTPVAYWLSFSPWRGKFAVESVVALPQVLPPTVLGFYILVGIGQHSPFGKFYESLAGHGLPFTFAGVVAASLVASLPFMVKPLSSAFSLVDRGLVDASAVLGASRLRTFFRVILPLSRNGVITGVVLSFAHALGEFGVVLMVGGNIPGVTRVVSIAIYEDVEAFNYRAANETALALVFLAFATLSIVYAVNRRIWVD